MSSTDPQPRQTDRWLEPGASNVQVIYILYLAGLVIGVSGIVGIVLAYLNRGKAGGWVETHYTWASAPSGSACFMRSSRWCWRSC